jgi:hypothetical protein
LTAEVQKEKSGPSANLDFSQVIAVALQKNISYFKIVAGTSTETASTCIKETKRYISISEKLHTFLKKN